MGQTLTAKQLFLKVRLYKFFGLVFAGIGICILFTIFVYTYEGNILLMAKEPSAFLVVIIPFLPAFVLAWIADGASKKALMILEKQAEDL